MRYHDDGVAFVMDLFKFFHDEGRGARVEIAGWLVGEDNLGLVDESAGDSGALLLAARELVGVIIFFFFETEAVEGFGGANETTGFVVAGIDEGEGDVFNDGEVGD